MIDELEKTELPDWLKNLDKNSIKNETLPINNILKDSFYYPASAFDGKPVKFFLGNFYSFIYVDYSLSKEEFNQEIDDRGFRGYDILEKRDLKMSELIPNGWSPKITKLESRRPLFTSEPFAYWIVFQRKEGLDESHNPERFSLLYICGDGVATFQALYHSNKTKPKGVAIIRPGTGFGNNWTNFRDEDKIFAENVLGNNSGIPKYLINDQMDSNWSRYTNRIKLMNVPSRSHTIYSIWQQ